MLLISTVSVTVRYLLQLITLLVTSSASCPFCHLTARVKFLFVCLFCHLTARRHGKAPEWQVATLKWVYDTCGICMIVAGAHVLRDDMPNDTVKEAT